MDACISKSKSEGNGGFDVNGLTNSKSESDELINKLFNLLNELIKIDDKLNRNALLLCEGCREKKIEKLITKCGNEEMARLLYESKLNSYGYFIRWIPFNEFENIKYLAKGGFGEVQKAEWIDFYGTYVVLKRLYNSRDKILDILKEVNKKKV